MLCRATLVIRHPSSYVLGLYNSYKALSSGRYHRIRDYVAFWVVSIVFATLEPLLDLIGGAIPGYGLAKLAFRMLLVLPPQRGIVAVYRKAIHPTLRYFEQDIDYFLTHRLRNLLCFAWLVTQRLAWAILECIAQVIKQYRARILAQLTNCPSPLNRRSRPGTSLL
ncbi:Receptor expression-enhancing protein 2 [Dimargaris xerosporica]|nr:Receptor expression-enhancing protein 2 [Dimargaris xerosporica]